MTRIALFNDTGRFPHIGCRGVTSGHDRMLARLGISVAYRSYVREWTDLSHIDVEHAQQAFHASELVSLLDEVDAVVVNGEGTIHHYGGLQLLAIMRGAQSMGIPTYLVNAVFQESESDLETLRRLNDFTVRDAASSAYLTRLGVPHRIVLDSILEAEFFERPAQDLRGRIAVTDWHEQRNSDVGAALNGLLDSLGDDGVFYPLEEVTNADAWQHAVADLRTARLVVTGRHHGVYLAGMAGVPFVAFGSNTWKVEGLLSLLPGAQQVCTGVNDLSHACRRALDNAELFTEIRQYLESHRPLQTFAALTHVPKRDVAISTR